MCACGHLCNSHRRSGGDESCEAIDCRCKMFVSNIAPRDPGGILAMAKTALGGPSLVVAAPEARGHIVHHEVLVTISVANPNGDIHGPIQLTARGTGRLGSHRRRLRDNQSGSPARDGPARLEGAMTPARERILRLFTEATAATIEQVAREKGMSAASDVDAEEIRRLLTPVILSIPASSIEFLSRESDDEIRRYMVDVGLEALVDERPS